MSNWMVSPESAFDQLMLLRFVQVQVGVYSSSKVVLDVSMLKGCKYRKTVPGLKTYVPARSIAKGMQSNVSTTSLACSSCSPWTKSADMPKTWWIKSC